MGLKTGTGYEEPDEDRLKRIERGIVEIKSELSGLGKKIDGKPQAIPVEENRYKVLHGCGWLLNPYGCLTILAGIATFVATFSLGPIDFGRSVYNQIVGDTPVLKRHLVDYVRQGIKREISKRNIGIGPAAELEGLLVSDKVEMRLAAELNAPMRGGRVDPTETSIEYLWDASENYARNLYHQWVWPPLE